MESKTDMYIDYINENILPRIDYNALQQSYETADRGYAKSILNLLHEAVIRVYGDEIMKPDDILDMEDSFVVIPGVVQGRNTGRISLALLEIDMASSGEHWNTHFLCKHGVLPQDGGNLQEDIVKPFIKEYSPFEYCYTAVIPNDIHIRHDQLLEGIKDMLSTFREHKAELLLPPEQNDISNHRPHDEDEGDMEQ